MTPDKSPVLKQKRFQNERSIELHLRIALAAVAKFITKKKRSVCCMKFPGIINNSVETIEYISKLTCNKHVLQMQFSQFHVRATIKMLKQTFVTLTKTSL